MKKLKGLIPLLIGAVVGYFVRPEIEKHLSNAKHGVEQNMNVDVNPYNPPNQ